ncbi:hypothetical protein ACF07Y_38625 [Streptomyces sp. NPDC016566]
MTTAGWVMAADAAYALQAPRGVMATTLDNIKGTYPHELRTLLG